MKNATVYVLFITAVVVLVPILIVKGCGHKIAPGEDEKIKGLTIKVYSHSEGKVIDMELEEYIKGVVAAEMPAEFELEALKAQAVAARTYAYGRLKKIYASKLDVHDGADICTDAAHCQAWVGKEEAMRKWGIFNAGKYWRKISRAVSETEGMIIVYDGLVANPVFHSNSGGKTENAEDVWEGGSVPYLRSVFSSGEEMCPEYKHTVSVKIKDFYNKLKAEYPALKLNTKDVLKDISVVDYTEGGRVRNVRIGNIVVKGTDFRRIFALRSANFQIEKDEAADSLKITTYGNGHGVGMSQWGANSMARSGGNFEEILKYYYKGVELSKIQD